MPESRFPLIAILLVLIAVFAIYGIILVPGSTFAGMDFLNLNYPRAVLTSRAWQSGHIPLWNWYEWGGVPLLAALQGAVFYPVTWLSLAMPLPYGLQVFVFLHLVAAGIGTYFLTRRTLRIPPFAAAFAAIVYVGAAFFIGRIEQFQIIAVNCLLPWLILTMHHAVFHRHPRRPWLALVWLFTLLAGHPQFAAFNLLGAFALVGLTAALMPNRHGFHWRSTITRWWRVAWQLALGTGMAAIQLLPTWELSQLSERIWPYPDPNTPQLSWENLPALVIPRFYNFITGQPGRVTGYTELGLYAGILTVPFAIAGVIWAIRKRKSNPQKARARFVMAAALIWLFALLCALGSEVGLADLIFHHAPFFKQTRGAARSLNVAALMLALVSSAGFAWLMSALSARQINSSKASSTFLKKPYLTAIALCILTIADIASTHHRELKSVLVPTSALSTRPIIPDAIQSQLHLAHTRAYRFMAFDSDLYLNNSPAAVAERNIRLQPNLASIRQIALVDGYEEGLLPLRAYANLLRRYNRNLRGPSPDAALLNLLGARFMLTEYPLQPDTAQWQPASPNYPRPAIVPAFDPETPSAYQWWESPYPAARAYDLHRLLPEEMSIEDFMKQAQAQFPLTGKTRDPMATEARDHLFNRISPAAYTAAAQQLKVTTSYNNWNKVTVSVQPGTSTALLMMPPYPGWKLSQKYHSQAVINPLNSLSYILQFRSTSTTPPPVQLIFSPNSFRIGLFLSLLNMTVFLAHLLPGRGSAVKHSK